MINVNIPEALSWKHNNTEGIKTRAGVLIEWPTSLGTFPTQIQIDQWEAEYLVELPEIIANQEITQNFETARIARLIFEIEFDQENRVRILEGKSTITKSQYRDALKVLLKTL